ncbi:hypothetical protein RN001_015691 [Aquatica leii]|uniref:Regulator of microtubule dynamics protein 1 n=1 Tax=Aquatica leii TaxID=1421715 RepID=A0AAN7PNC0_9COLE|nr:hypothetical protein RN001_015691 [Aquatica leii]
MLQVFGVAGYSFMRRLPKYYGRYFLCSKQMHALTIVGHITAFRDYLFGTKKASKNENGSQLEKTDKVIAEADLLYLEGKYYEAYQLLNTVFDRLNSSVLWRISRVLFSIASNETLSYGERKHLIFEAYHLAKEAEEKTKTNFEVYKWLAILLKAKIDYATTHEKLKNIPNIKRYLMAALELNSRDITVLYLLGHWHYELASLTWFQKKLVTFFYSVIIPEANFQEAYEYFFKIETLKPNYFVTNTWMLAKSCYRIQNYEEANYYFDIVDVLSYRTTFERRCMNKIKKNYKNRAV